MSPLKPVVRITNQFDHAETLFLMMRYGVNRDTVPEILSLIECAQDFTEAIHSGPNEELDWDAIHAAKERKQERLKQRQMLNEAEYTHAVMAELRDFVQELKLLGFNVQVLP